MSAGQAIGAIAGAVIGFYTGGPAGAWSGAAKGAAWGYTIGGALDPQTPDVYGPKAIDNQFQQSVDGAVLPQVFGTDKIAGNVIWYTGLREVAHSEDIGGGSGGGGATSTSYTYDADFAIAICEGSISGVRRIWADSKLIYDVSTTASAETLAKSGDVAKGFLLYLGTSSQSPDPLMQAAIGVDDTPAFLDTAYIVFEAFQLADYGNRLPAFSFEVVKSSTSQDTSLVSTETYSGLTGTSGSISVQPYFDGSVAYCWTLRHNPNSSTVVTEFDAWIMAQVPGGDITLDKYIQVTTPLPELYRYWLPLVQNHNSKKLVTISYGYSPYNKPAYCNIHYASGGQNSILFIDKWGSEHRCTGAASLDDETVFLSVADYNYGYVYKLDIYGYVQVSAAFYGGAGANQSFVLVGMTSDYLICKAGIASILFFDKNTLTLVSTKYDYSRKPINVVDDMLFLGVDSGSTTNQIKTISGTTLSTLRTLTMRTDGKLLSRNIVIDFKWWSNWPNGTYWESKTYKDGVIGVTTQTLKTTCEALAVSTKLPTSYYDFSALSALTVTGYSIGAEMSVRAAIEPLMKAYHFDIVERDGKLKAILRHSANDATLVSDDLGYSTEPQSTKISIKKTDVMSLPSEVRVTFKDIDNEYEPGTQYARKLTAPHTNVSTLNIPLVMTSADAAKLAETELNIAWYSGLYALSFACGYSKLGLIPTDVVSVSDDDSTWRVRLTQVDIGAPGIVECTGVPELYSLYSAVSSGADASGIGQELLVNGPMRAELIDCVMLRHGDNEPGFYVAARGYSDGWRGGVIFKSSDGGATWGKCATVTKNQAALTGIVLNGIGDADSRVWDKRNSINVRLDDAGAGLLSSTTELNLLSGANSVLVGADGRWELLQFMTSTYNGDGTYTLTDLLRGRKGTEYAVSAHAAYDKFIFLGTDTIGEIELSNSEMDSERLYKYVSVGQLIEAVPENAATNDGVRVMPLSPVQIGGGRSSSGDVLIKWVRRDRINAGWNNYSDAPMSEASESYEIDVFSDGTYTTLKRTISAATQSATYTSAQQVTDFGSNQSTVYVKIYQLSAAAGRGFAGTGAV